MIGRGTRPATWESITARLRSAEPGGTGKIKMHPPYPLPIEPGFFKTEKSKSRVSRQR